MICISIGAFMLAGAFLFGTKMVWRAYNNFYSPEIGFESLFGCTLAAIYGLISIIIILIGVIIEYG